MPAKSVFHCLLLTAGALSAVWWTAGPASAAGLGGARRVISLDGSWELGEGAMESPPAAFGSRVPVPGLVDLAAPPLEEVGLPSPRREAFWYRRSFQVAGPRPAVAIVKVHKAMFGSKVEDAERADRPWRAEWVRRLHQAFRDMHWNSLRYCIGFPPELWYDIADEAGIMIQDEFPIWSVQPGTADYGADELTEEYTGWLRERWNHPCVVVWDACNETLSPATTAATRKVRGLDLSDRPWDNGYSPPVAPARTGAFQLEAALLADGAAPARSLRDFEVLTEAQRQARYGIAVGKPVKASANLNRDGATTPEAAADGNPGTRWSSEFSDLQWIAVDLGQPERIGRVVLDWETAWAKVYALEISQDGTQWKEVLRREDGKGGSEELRFEPVETRWVRLRCERRATNFGYSLWEFRVFRP